MDINDGARGSFKRRALAAGVVLTFGAASGGALGAQRAGAGPGQPAAASRPSQSAPSFAVASVRPNRSGGRPGGVRPLPSGQLTATNVTLRDLILRAYDLHESQLVGGPSWIASDRFDILAKAETPPPGGIRDVMSMLRALLVERFALRVHTEMRTLPTYAMLLARSDRAPGPQLRISTIDCSANPASPVPNTAQADAQGWPPCGLALVRTTLGKARTRVEAKHSAVTMQGLAAALQRDVGRPVVDRTGLSGMFDVEYAYTQESPAAGGAAVAALANLPDMFTAFQEQLGLKLESQQNPVEVLVVDAVEQPSAN